MKLDFVIVGAHKSGTTWLQKCLETHPEICMPQNPAGNSKEKKPELEFFNDTQMPWRKDLTGHSNYPKGLDWYASFFEHCNDENVMHGEASPVYLHAPEAARRIKKHFPDTKIIALLREPVERLKSLYLCTRANDEGARRVPKTFEEFVAMPGVLELNYYYSQLQNYRKYFKDEQIGIWIYRDIRNNPYGLLEDVYNFLGVTSEHYPEEVTKKVNSIESRYNQEQKRRLKDRYGRYLGSILHSLLPTQPAPQKEALTIPKDTKRKLVETYRPEIHQLEEYLGRELPHWKNHESS